MKGNRLAEHLACRSTGTIMVICSNLTVSTTSNVGKVFLRACVCAVVHTCTPTHVHPQQQQPFRSDAQFTEQIGHVHKGWKWNNRKRAVALAISQTHTHTCARRVRVLTHCTCNNFAGGIDFFFCAHEHPRKKDLAASSAQMAILSPGEAALSGPAVLTIGTILPCSQCPPRPAPSPPLTLPYD